MQYLAAALVLALAAPFPLAAQTGFTNYTVYGIVRLPAGEPAARVTVRITSHSGLDRQVFSDDMGRYEFRDLPRGRYQISATNPVDPDQVTDLAEADTSRSSGQRLLVHLYMRNRTITESKPGRPANSVVSVGEATQRIPKPALKAYEHAMKLKNERKSEEALQELNKAVDLYPGYFQALAARGYVKVALDRSTDAAADFAQSLQLNPRYEPALRGSGMCKFEQARHGEAIQDLESAIAIDPNIASTHLFLGIANLALDRRDQARASLERALRLDPGGASRAHVHLARIYLKEDRFQDALTQLQSYLAQNPTAPDAANLRSVESQIRAKLTPKP